MKLNRRQLAFFLMVLVALIQGAYGIQITATGGSDGNSGTVSSNFDTLNSAAVSGYITISGAT